MTPHGLKPNNRNLNAVKNFLPPTNLKQLQQFLGLTSYYRHFIPDYAEIAYPLHALTRKGALFEWSAECEVVLEILKSKLLSPPILAYPDFKKDFVLETDASKLGLGAILSQRQEDNRLWPVGQSRLLKLTTLLPIWRH